tara:strand:+ start:968 stop:1579 length:612 start_codon:yes stop_codon:yes gene_type:complete
MNEEFVYVDTKGVLHPSGTVRMTPHTYKMGVRIKEMIDTHKNRGEDLSLRKLAKLLSNEQGFKVSYERVRQICQKMNIEKPRARTGPPRTTERTPNFCPECNKMMPLVKNTNRPVKRCPNCKPSRVDCVCANCKKDFHISTGEYRSRTDTERGYSGKLFCSRDCFYEHQKNMKWWTSSPIYKAFEDDEDGKSLKEIVEIVKNR